MLKTSLIIVTVLVVAIASLFIYQSQTNQSLFAGTAPTNLGINDGKFAPCLTTPNCVSSQANINDPQHYIAPIKYESDAITTQVKLKELLESQKLTKIVTQTDGYIYAQFTSQLMGFIDDVEFYFTPEAKLIQVRSASRLGESDLGVNRQRIEQIRSKISAV